MSPQNAEDAQAPQVALIVGGASGIGLASARIFRNSGWAVAIADIQEEAGRNACAEFDIDPELYFRTVDVRNSASVRSMVASVFESFGRIDVLINSAGIGAVPGLPHMLEDEAFFRALEINLMGVFYVMREVVPVMLKQRKGAIVNLASVGGMHGMPYGCEYGTSKAGVISLTRSFARAYTQKGLRINAISPAWIETPMLTNVLEKRGPSMREKMKSDIPMGHLGDPEEVARTIYHVACEATFMSGSNVVVDGGMAS